MVITQSCLPASHLGHRPYPVTPPGLPSPRATASLSGHPSWPAQLLGHGLYPVTPPSLPSPWATAPTQSPLPACPAPGPQCLPSHPSLPAQPLGRSISTWSPLPASHLGHSISTRSSLLGCPAPGPRCLYPITPPRLPPGPQCPYLVTPSGLPSSWATVSLPSYPSQPAQSLGHGVSFNLMAGGLCVLVPW